MLSDAFSNIKALQNAAERMQFLVNAIFLCIICRVEEH